MLWLSCASLAVLVLTEAKLLALQSVQPTTLTVSLYTTIHPIRQIHLVEISASNAIAMSIKATCNTAAVRMLWKIRSSLSAQGHWPHEELWGISCAQHHGYPSITHLLPEDRIIKSAGFTYSVIKRELCALEVFQTGTQTITKQISVIKVAREISISIRNLSHVSCRAVSTLMCLMSRCC